MYNNFFISSAAANEMLKRVYNYNCAIRTIGWMCAFLPYAGCRFIMN